MPCRCQQQRNVLEAATMLAARARYELLDPLGRPTFLEDILGSRPTLLCFLRHFGCLFCFEHAANVLHVRAKLEAQGAQVVFIGNGNPSHAREFIFEHGLSGGVFTDPSRQLYRSLDLKHGMGRTLNVRSIRHAQRAYRQGFSQRGVKGDPWQQAGNVAVSAQGEVLCIQRAEVAGEVLSVDKLVAALTRDATRPTGTPQHPR